MSGMWKGTKIFKWRQTVIATRKLKPGRQHDIPGSKNKYQWPPLSDCCSEIIHYQAHTGCDKEKIVFENHYYCPKCGEFLGFRRQETNFKDQ